MNSWALAARAAASISSPVASGLPKRRFVLDRAVEEVGVLVHHRDIAR